MRRQTYSLARKTHSRKKAFFSSWRWRALLGTLLVLLSFIPINQYLSDRSTVEALPCSCTIFSDPTGHSNFAEGSDLELGVKFSSNTDGYIRGVRFYKQGAMSGTHTGRLWTNGGSELANATFTESSSGWQEVYFSSPVAITSGTTYVASVTMNDGNYISTPAYFSGDVTNGPLTAPASGNGVFNVNAGQFPTSSFNSSNYWIDVSFFDQTAPQVSSVSPTNGSSGVQSGETVSATFDQSMDSSTFTSSTFTVKDPQNNTVAGSYAYTESTKTVAFIATNGFSVNTVYTVTLEGGSGTVVENGAGLALAADYTWSFTTETTNTCPCSLKDRVAPAGSSTFDDSGGVELGIKVKPTTNGYITAIRFYKPIISTETTHTARIWSSTGTELTSVTFSNESDYGWQEARLSTPFQVNADQLYIVSYSTSTAVYQATGGGLNATLSSGYLVAHADTSSENAATGSGNRNGVFTTTVGTYPNNGSTNGSYYWIDAVFATQASPTYSLSVGVTQPTANSYGAPHDQAINATFNRTLDSATVTNSTFRLFDSSNVQVSGTGTYNAAKGMATFTPTSSLTYGQRYTARLSASIADPAGTTLGTEYSWSFTVGSALASDYTLGPGGPILVVTSTSTNKYSTYYAEILRAEGLNHFDVKDISQVNATMLGNYNAVVLAEMGLSQSQADMLGTWVTAGGNLVAMRPDDELASLLGLTDAGTTRTNQYLLVDTATTPGTGIVGETIQWKGTADNYSLNGATAVAMFYSDASTSTSNPAVTLRSVGSNGGTAAAFAYDLAKSVIAQHQGNQAWAGQNRDNDGPTRANDLFFGNKSGDVQPDWTDLSKFHIPQADEQQRLLANMLIESVRDQRPLPRFWYLPGEYKAAMVMAGDDHGLSNASGTERNLNDFLNESATNCSLADWQCARASHYVYESSALTNTRATQYYNLGFGIGDHVSNTCSNWVSLATLTAEYTADLATWRAKYSGVPNQTTHRYHCYVWADWDSQIQMDVANDIRYDLNYVNYPGSWFGTRAPLMTGSAMNMRFTDADGDMVNVHQGVTNIDDQSSNITNINALFGNALDSDGFYGIFGTHYDMVGSFDNVLYSAAQSLGVPVISSEQALTWLDGRDSSAFSNFGGSDGQYTFDITAGVGANNLQAMLPTQDAGGTLTSLTLAGSTVSYQTQTVKGVQYAVFDANPGSYTATYSDFGAGTGGGGSSGSGGGTTTTKKKTTITTTEEPTVTPTGESEQEPAPPEIEKELIRPIEKGGEGSWLWWLLVGFIAGILFGAILFAVRRRRQYRHYTTK